MLRKKSHLPVRLWRLAVVGVVMAAAVIQGASAAGPLQEKEAQKPEKGAPEAGTYRIRSYPVFLISKGDRSEIVVCGASMAVKTEKEFTNRGGRRQVNLEILNWRARGRSELLGGALEFRMTKSGTSWVIGGEKGFFPAEAQFAMQYEVETPLGTVGDLDGKAVGPIKAFPPRQDVFRIEKDLSIRGITVTPIACACVQNLVGVQVTDLVAEPSFPKPGRFEIESYPIFYITRGAQSEIVVCKAKMTVESGEVYANKKQRRQVDVEVLDWKASGNSRILGGRIEFRLTKSLKSWVISGERKFFPAEAQFAMQYEVETPLGTVGGLTGIAAGPIKAFPPRQDVFRIEKDLSIGGVTVAPIACACPAAEFLGVQTP